ncbi:hypothetical protein H9W90_13375 [Polaribacter pectinis]|uniref:Uncharacterized protein n=1 Tax=Polaribacter pectinis TaxID=2738844 RepID=A0A7G9L970_9FLAO|nr:DUF6252 family protein [Polaribacter pectinis]QNM85169.1 hypothetical protein H9W90_13375 [Polaribacter pectinis]
MKKTIYLSILVLFFITSCEESGINFPTDNTQQLESGFSVNIDGVLFSTDKVDFTSDGVDIFINASKPETNEIFTLKTNNFSLGNFSFEGADNIASYVKNDPVSADVWSTINATSSKGNIEFTSIDNVNNTVSGVFNFTGKNLVNGSEKEFVSGVFTNVAKSVLPPSDNKFFAKVDGNEYKTISLFGSFVTVGKQELIMISANKSLSETIGFSINSDITVGEYDFGSFITQTYPTGQYSVGGTTYVADGKMNIKTHDTANKTISGTFAFDASPVISNTVVHKITEGEFTISY